MSEALDQAPAVKKKKKWGTLSCPPPKLRELYSPTLHFSISINSLALLEKLKHQKVNVMKDYKGRETAPD
jgi:hypothetical protein